ncbi:MAG: hypothetical protein CVU06_09390 [Bacteroidetes bacterium HGW-Bacteroidetes-22]|nr:MAG: hypothetical protein CVU06_09390 [Bacteroidetes bacterium HGW-Bacteroidetes-22]
MNLKRLHCKGIDYVIGIGYFYTIAVGIICFVMPFGSMSATGYLINVVAGFIMVYQFTNKYYPGDMEYKKRNPLPAYLVGFSIVMLVLLIIFRNIIY